MPNYQYIDWSNIKAVIFDVDGTLYDIKKMRRMMFREIAKYLVRHSQQFSEFLVLKNFRKMREYHRHDKELNLEQAQYHWTALDMNVPDEAVRRVVEKWMFQEPLKYLISCRYKGVVEVFELLKNRGIKIAVVSDYPPLDKLACLGLSCDLSIYTADKPINRFKPDPEAFLAVRTKFNLESSEILVIGDREECEGQAAKEARIPYLILEKDGNKFYQNLLKNWQ